MWIRICMLVLIATGLMSGGCRRGKGQAKAWQESDWGVPATVAAPHHPNEVASVAETDVALTPLARCISAFACDLYGQLREQKGNLFLSPYSLSTVLAMVYAGARGDTERQMAAALHFDLGQEFLHPAFTLQQKLFGSYQRNDALQICQADSLWPQIGEHFVPEYLSLMRTAYGTEITPVDFRDADAVRRQINQWAAEKTQGRIIDVISPGLLNQDTCLVLGNAIYFEGRWASPFYKKKTTIASFKLSHWRSRNVSMMYKKHTFRYAEFPALQILELPYRGNELSMLVFLPRDITGYKDLERHITWDRLQNWQKALQPRQVEVHIPRFEVLGDYRLDTALQALGMVNAFSESKADFSGMVRPADRLFITFVVQQAWIKVDEEGTKAAAATFAGGGRGRVPDPPVFRADHPFLFLIQDNQTGMILFMGRIADPGVLPRSSR